MATNIEWTDETWQVTTGCEEVSPGCGHCYARTMAKRLRAMALADIAAGRDPGKKRFYIDAVDDSGRWTKTVVPRPDALDEPDKWRKPRTVFVDSMSDLFHKDVPFEFLDHVFAVMALASRHTYQVLTKRPERAAEYLNEPCRQERISKAASKMIGDNRAWLNNWPLRSVWIGTSVEDQRNADERIPHLLRCPAAVRFLSCEPLLGPVDLTVRYPCGAGAVHNMDSLRGYGGWGDFDRSKYRIHWVIVGGESGHGARSCNIAWIRSIVEQCKAAGVSCFVKQLGAKVEVANDSASEWPRDGDGWIYDADGPGFSYQGEPVVIRLQDKKGGDISEWPEDLRVRQFPKSEPPPNRVMES